MVAYYNEFKPEAAHMLRQLIKDGHIAPGEVDERSITDVKADELKGFTQCHFFAGIGGWSVALRLAGWDDNRPVWTGSCPCQPFSTAGQKKGHGDERHLWPHWFRLIRECRPATVFGEQVAGAVAFGWLDEVFNDLETEAYACAAAVLPACSIGKPHKRDRLWFLANAGLHERGGWDGLPDTTKANARTPSKGQASGIERQRPVDVAANGRTRCDVGDTAITGFSQRGSGEIQQPRPLQKSERPSIMGDTISTGLEGYTGDVENIGGGGVPEWINCPDRSLWLTPSANEDAAGTVNGKMQKMLTHQAKEAEILSGSNAPTENQGQLNVEFVCWLMGYSTEHLCSMRLAMQSFRKSRQNSLKQRMEQ